MFPLVSPLDEDDEGQFEGDDDEDEDRGRRMVSESPVNKIEPIPETKAFFIFSHNNQ